MTLYIDEDYYINEFQGTAIPNESLEKCLELAQEKIDSITFNRIVKIGFSNLTEFQQEKISKAICYQAEYIYENGYNAENSRNISSYNVLDISVSVDNSKKSSAESLYMSEIAYDLLLKTGLMCRRL